MKDKETNITHEKICFNYKTNETKYYLLTKGSGYPLAEFSFPAAAEMDVKKFIIPENTTKTDYVVS